MEEYVAQPFEDRVKWLERTRALLHPR
jgi:hypothetical protein